MDENSQGGSMGDPVFCQHGAQERANQPRLRGSQETKFYWSSLPPKAHGKNPIFKRKKSGLERQLIG